MRTLYYIGLDIHKKVIAYCVKTIDGGLIGAGTIAVTRKALDEWLNGLPGSWIGAMQFGSISRFARMRHLDSEYLLGGKRQ